MRAEVTNQRETETKQGLEFVDNSTCHLSQFSLAIQPFCFYSFWVGETLLYTAVSGPIVPAADGDIDDDVDERRASVAILLESASLMTR